MGPRGRKAGGPQTQLFGPQGRQPAGAKSPTTETQVCADKYAPLLLALYGGTRSQKKPREEILTPGEGGGSAKQASEAFQGHRHPQTLSTAVSTAAAHAGPGQASHIISTFIS